MKTSDTTTTKTRLRGHRYFIVDELGKEKSPRLSIEGTSSALRFLESAPMRSNPNCRCGWNGTGDHPCHYRNYSCRAPATPRFYEPSPRYSLSGQQDKRSVTETFACDACWKEFVESRNRAEISDILIAHGYTPMTYMLIPLDEREALARRLAPERFK